MRHTFVMVPFVIAFIAAASPTPAQTSPANDPLQRRLPALETEFEELRNAIRIPGMSAAVVKDQQLVWSKGFGNADLEKKIPVTPDTPFRIASLTKTFASTLLMQLVEQGKLNLDDPMSKYAPEYESALQRIAVPYSLYGNEELARVGYPMP